jgi:hypothetical protein
VSPPTAEERRAELVEFALERLPEMRLADGAFCHEVVAPGERASGGRLGRGRRVSTGEGNVVRGRSLRYSWIVLVGLLRDAGIRPSVDPAELKGALIGELGAPEIRAGDLGLALWADARSGSELAPRALSALAELLGRTGLEPLEGLEVSWVAVGAAEAAAAGAGAAAERTLAAARERLVARAATPSQLLLHHEAGGRARFPHFATQVYGVLALARLAALRDDREAARVAAGTANRLLDLQLTDGAWPWIYDVEQGRVVETYRLYSVHQDAMAPMALFELSEVTGDGRYREAALRGLEWIWGANEMGLDMLDPNTGLLYRSINRRGAMDRLALWLNSASAYAGQTIVRGGPVEVERTDRPYHLGWVLEAWAGRSLKGIVSS